ncbi:transcription initiation factor TFIID subunit 14 [Verticillium dahliae VdLs.17]|uniref:Transcription initiation factor TFIID subunit 14 n=1 Tax=Verticillium dahliae (strain VdLs.17 / ATCC MYA-4575 / FGSC 10137) TaxID=498257 RepID=G2XI43_VERDV|nr:transcription initiation factor TFIID subunit 14 [Verticillium dahliae VdLs.17]EGY19491.1 transcription initiation factor TFIID subunit 14 [Verticillium dahliae VdLs.17]
MIVERKIRLVTDQNVMPDKPAQVEGFPMRKWSVSIFVLDEAGEEHTADCFQKVVYNLHPSFENPTQSWGEFEMVIDCYTTEKSKQSIPHDLNFQSNHYVSEHTVSFKNPSQALQQILRETGPLPNDEDRAKRKGAAGAAGPKKASQKYDYEKIADGLGRLEEDDLLRVIQIINDNRTEGMFIKSDVDGEWPGLSCPKGSADEFPAGEFSIDLYSMPETLTKLLWDHLVRLPSTVSYECFNPANHF